MKRCCTSYVIREMQIKLMRYHYPPVRMPQFWNSDKADKDMKQQELSDIVSGNAKGCHYHGR